MGGKPDLDQIKSEIQRYASFQQKIDDIKPIIILESIELSTGNVTVVFFWGHKQGLNL